MRFGIHLPQYGHAAGPAEIHRASVQAEDLGFSDLWVFDHLAVPAGQSYPVAYSYEPIVTLTWAAAVTRRIGIGTSILVLPYRHPVFLAKALGSLDLLSGGRLILGAGAGWLESEFTALGVPFTERGSRTDEAVDFLRAAWEGGSPVSFSGPHLEVESMRILPAPGRRIPIWIGGTSDAALRRAARRGDGWQAAFVEPAAMAGLITRLRDHGVPDGFTFSIRLEWDGLGTDHGLMRDSLDLLAEAGVDHVLAAPAQGDIDSWCRSVDVLWGLFSGLDR